jgi:hypothetical protein
VIDGQVTGGGGFAKFRIRIWNASGGGLVYDNQLNAPDSADPTTMLGGGSIVIHNQSSRKGSKCGAKAPRKPGREATPGPVLLTDGAAQQRSPTMRW